MVIVCNKWRDVVNRGLKIGLGIGNMLLIVALVITMSNENLKAQTISPENICKKLHLIPGEKAMIQWQRVFKNPRKLKRYGLDKLDLKDRKELEEYLVNHAADSDQPMVAGM